MIAGSHDDALVRLRVEQAHHGTQQMMPLRLDRLAPPKVGCGLLLGSGRWLCRRTTELQATEPQATDQKAKVT